MSLIVERPDVTASFMKEWTKFVPAIISYGEKSTKKSIEDLLVSLKDKGVLVYMHCLFVFHLICTRRYA